MFGEQTLRDVTELTQIKISDRLTLFLILSDCGTIPLKVMHSINYLYDTLSSHTLEILVEQSCLSYFEKKKRDVTEHQNVT